MEKKLIIIGNGFDISHGLNTKYDHFIFNYFTKCLLSSIKNRKRDNPRYYTYTHQDDLINLSYSKINRGSENRLDVDQDYIIDFVEQFSNFKELYNEMVKQQMFSFTPNNISLLNKILNPFLNWVDIENTYFDYLVELWEQRKTSNPQHDVIKLNNQFRFLKSELINYLKCLDSRLRFVSEKELTFKDDFTELIYGDTTSSMENEEMLILNFNYLDTFRKNYRLSNKSKHIFIHGSVHSHLSDIVFGYGNDDHNVLNEMINENSDDYFQFRKINHYTSKEKKMLDSFIKNSKYNIQILGHSLGLTDKTLLKEVFLNDNFKELSLFQYGENLDFRKNKYNNQVQKITKICGQRSNEVLGKINSYEDRYHFPPPIFHKPLLNMKYLESQSQSDEFLN